MLSEGVFAVTRVEQRAIEVANMSLLALYKEGQSDPDLPSVDPDYSQPELRHGPRVPHMRLGIGPTTFVRCRIVEYVLPPTVRYPPNSEPQLVSLSSAGESNKELRGFF